MDFYKCRNVKSPNIGTPGSAGIDFFVPEDQETLCLNPGKGVNIPSGLHVRIPSGFGLVMMNKSGIAVNKQLQVGACVIDEDYEGEIHLHVINIGNQSQYIHPGDKLVQGLLLPIGRAGLRELSSLDSLYDGNDSERGAGGFGSTGTK